METLYRSYRLAEEKLEANFFVLSTAFFVVFNLVFDLSLGTLFACLLPDFIRRFKRASESGSDEQLRLFPTAGELFDGDDELMNEHKRALRKRNLFLSSTRTLLANAILNGNLLGEWNSTVVSILQLATTGLCSGCFMYLNPTLLTNPTNYLLNSSNNATLLLLLHALKTAYLIYRIISVLLRFTGDISAGLILNHLVYLLLVIEALNSNRFFAFVTFGYLIDLQGIFHFFRRAFIFIQLTDTQPYHFCNVFDLVLVTLLRPYVHFHQFNWLYTVYGFKRDHLWYLAALNASLQSLDTLFLLFDYFNLLVSTLQEVRVRGHLPLFDPDTFRPNDRPVFSKLRRYDSDTEILYLK